MKGKTEHFNVRATAAQARLIKAGAACRDVDPTNYILDSACVQAEMDLADRNHFLLPAKAWKAFMKALDSPPKPSPDLKRLFVRSSDLEKELRAVARGEKTAPADAAEPSIESVEALVHILSPDNCRLMKIIRDKKPQSIAELSKPAHRAEPNLLCTLAKLQAVGLVELKTVDGRKVPVAVMGKLHVEIDPYGTTTDSFKNIPAHRFKNV